MNYPHPPMPMAMQRPGAFPPTPPHSLPRSSNGHGPMSSHNSPIDVEKHAHYSQEDQLIEHHRTLTRFLAAPIHEEIGGSEPVHRARDKLLRLTSIQFSELSIDVYDELLRREHERRYPPVPNDPNYPRFLLPRSHFHPKRNQARQKLATLATNKFRELVGDVLFELERRNPQLAGITYPPRKASPPGPHTPSHPGSLRSQRSHSNMRSPSNPSLRTRARSSSRSGPRAAPPPLPAYVQGLRRPSIPTTPNLPSSTPVSPIGPYSPPSDVGFHNFSSPQSYNEYGRPLPRDYQTPQSARSKASRADEFDEKHDGNVSESDYAPNHISRRGTNKSLPFSMEPTIPPETQIKLSQLEQKVEELEAQMRKKDEEIASHSKIEAEIRRVIEDEKAKSASLSANLETRIRSAENLNSALKLEVETLKANNARLVKEQEEHSYCEWKSRYENLKMDFNNQQRFTEQVRQEAAENLQEMRTLAEQSADASDREEQLARQISQLELSVNDWKSRYTKAKAQLRNLRAMSTTFNPGPANAVLLANDGSLTDPNGLVKDVSITQYQIAVDELLNLTRSGDPSTVLDYMRTIVSSVRAVTEDIDSPSTKSSPTSPTPTDETSRRHSKLKARVSAAANSLITAAKNYSAGAGLSPVSLVDAAAGNLTAAVVDLVKEVKVRQTPAGELELDEP